MLCIAEITELRERLNEWRKLDQKIALVPTMGNLHDGHISLVNQAVDLADKTVVSIFVNPVQFVEGEDFDQYPRTLEADLSMLENTGTDIVFNPGLDEIYPHSEDKKTFITVPYLENILCGKFRPGHFAGVALVVNKLFNIVEPDLAIFGEKDYQQLLVIKHLVKDLCMPIEIISGPTVREPDGVAISSRNIYLTESERKLAPVLYKTLTEIAEMINTGNRNFTELENTAIEILNNSGFVTEYVEIRDARDLGTLRTGNLVILAAAWLGNARLIDNVILNCLS